MGLPLREGREGEGRGKERGGEREREGREREGEEKGKGNLPPLKFRSGYVTGCQPYCYYLYKT